MSLGGCASRRVRAYPVLPETASDRTVETRARATLADLYPSHYRATQRAIISVGRKQFVCDGVLTVSPQNGAHLAVVSTLGLVAEVQVNTNHASRVLRVTPLFRPDWSREFVARDLRRLFLAPSDLDIAGRLLDGRFVLETRPALEANVVRYILSPTGEKLEEVEVARQGQRLYHALVRRYQKFAGVPAAVPAEFEVRARDYRLELRTAELVVSPTSSSAR